MYDELYHHGVKGMKWGVRKKRETKGIQKQKLMRIETKTSKGETLVLDQRHTPKFTAWLATKNKKVREAVAKDKSFKIKTKDGKMVGELELYKEAKDSLNVVWVGIDDSKRGRGYATATMKAAIKYAEQTGCKQVTLEVPGSSPDARHVYEKLGFKAGKQISDSDDVWGGLTEMKLDLRRR